MSTISLFWLRKLSSEGLFPCPAKQLQSQDSNPDLMPNLVLKTLHVLLPSGWPLFEWFYGQAAHRLMRCPNSMQEVSLLQGLFLNWAEHTFLWLCPKDTDSAIPSSLALWPWCPTGPKRSLFLTVTLQRFKVTDHPAISLLQNKYLHLFPLFPIWQGFQTLLTSTTFFRTHSSLTMRLLENWTQISKCIPSRRDWRRTISSLILGVLLLLTYSKSLLSVLAGRSHTGSWWACSQRAMMSLSFPHVAFFSQSRIQFRSSNN